MANQALEKKAFTAQDLLLDEAKLTAAAQSERAELFVLEWLAGVEKAVLGLDQATLIGSQPALTSLLLTFLTPPSPNSQATRPPPGRPARTLIGRILVSLLSRAEPKGLFDLGQALLKAFVGSEGVKGSVERECQWRVAAGGVLAAVWAEFAGSVMSLFAEVVFTSTKVYKTSSYASPLLPVILRCAGLSVLRQAIVTGAKSMSDQTIKDTLKTLRSGLSEKAGAVVRGCAECLLAMSAAPGTYTTLADIDQMLSPALKALDSADHTTAVSLARLVAGLLARTQEEGSALPLPVKKSAKKGEEEDAYPDVGAPPADAGKGTLLTPTEMLSMLSSVYNRGSTSRRARNAILQVYSEVLAQLGSAWAEAHYPAIAAHLIDEVGCGMAAGRAWTGWNARAAERLDPSRARYDALAARNAVAVLLDELVAGRLLSEGGQIVALRELAALYLKKWPALRPSAAAPSKQALVIALGATTSLLTRLGCAPPAVQEVVSDPLLRLISHPARSVQLGASWALRSFCLASPPKLASTIGAVVDLLNKDLALLGGPTSGTDVPSRALGHAHALAGLVNVIPHAPLYVSFDMSAKCMSLAIQLLKQSASHELKISAVEIQVAWILVGSLLSLGPNFVRLHLPQLLILWRNALPKPTAKDTSAAAVRSEAEWAFLLHIREATLAAILSFLRHNGPDPARGGQGGLVTDDVGRRLVLLLANGMAFATSFSTAHSSPTLEPVSPASGGLSLAEREVLLRRRLLQCFVALGAHPAAVPHQLGLLQQAVSLFADPDKYAGEQSLQAAINANAGTFTSIWDEQDGMAFGVTSLLSEQGAHLAGEDDALAGHKSARLNRDPAEARLEEQLRAAILGAPEYDALVLSSRYHAPGSSAEPSLGRPAPAATGVVDAAVELFALYWPQQESANQGALIQLMLNHYRSPRLEKNPGRKMSILSNSITAILGALRLYKQAVENHVATLMRDLIKEALLHSDARLRRAAAEALGRLSSLGGTAFMAAQIQFCVGQVVSNTDPHSRAGCALAFGQIYDHVGSLAAGPVLKTIVDVLLSLAADPHPLVHYTALTALAHVIGAASLAYAPFTNGTLGLICKLYMRETHEPEGGTPGSVNLRGDLPAYQAFCRVTDALVGVLGPELQEEARVRALVLLLLREFAEERDEGVKVEAIKATQHFLIFAPSALDLAQLVRTLRAQLSSTRQPLKVAAVNSVYQLVQKDALSMSKLGGDGLVRELFALLDDDPAIEGVRDAITSWLRQTADANPSGWIDLCQRIMSRSVSTNQAVVEEGLANVDEETQGLGVEEKDSRPPTKTSSRWRTQLFALQCLHEVFLTVLKSGRREHFDITRARAVRANPRTLLVSRVGDLIKMAFTASTAQVMQIRLEGLVVLRDVVEQFQACADMDFEEALLLEQFQAPIAAALTPAFAADSFPEVLASAVQVCAVFVGSGVIKEIERLGRILKLLTSALENCKDADMTSLGDVKDLSSTASVMLKTSIFAAWAQFQIASVRQEYLVKVIKPHLPLLAEFWVASLREYARVRTDPDATSSDSGVGGAAFDSVYSGLSRETALPFYERSWPAMLHAVASLLRAEDPHILRAVDGLASDQDLPSGTREEPAQYFWVLFGLAFEALCATPPPSGGTSPLQVQAIALEGVLGLSKRQVAGTALSEKGLFEEVCNLSFRLAITEGLGVKRLVMSVALQLATQFAEEARRREVGGQTNGSIVGDGSSLAEDPQLVQCLRIATTVLRESVPSSSSGPKPSGITLQAHANTLRSVFAQWADLADLYPNPMREQLYAIALHFYGQLLRDESLEMDLVGPTLPVAKMLAERGFAADLKTLPPVTLGKVAHGVLSGCLQNIDQTRSRRGKAAGLKTRNNLLAAVVLLTALPPSAKVGREVVERTCYLISETALAEGEASTAAVHCMTSLLAAGTSRGGVLGFCVGQLLPGLIEYIARAGERPELLTVPNDPRVATLAEAIKSLTSTLTSVPPERRTQSLSIALPTLINLLQPERATSQQSTGHTLALQALLGLAGTFPVNFKEVNAGLEGEMRSALEGSIRASLGGQKVQRAVEVRPSIGLKSFG